MQELIAQEPKNWLQLYVDAVTEKDPYKRLALVRRLREVPRHDESDENPERPRFQLVPKRAIPIPSPRSQASPVVTSAEASPKHAIRNRKVKSAPKTQRQSQRLRRA